MFLRPNSILLAWQRCQNDRHTRILSLVSNPKLENIFLRCCFADNFLLLLCLLLFTMENIAHIFVFSFCCYAMLLPSMAAAVPFLPSHCHFTLYSHFFLFVRSCGSSRKSMDLAILHFMTSNLLAIRMSCRKLRKHFLINVHM